MKLALITALKQDRSYQTAIPPLTFGYLAAYLRKYAPETVELAICADAAEVIAERPDIIGISCVSENYPLAVALAQQFRIAPGVPVILGGPHISVMPETLHRAFDVGVVGEGEETLIELLAAFGEGLTPGRLSAIKGIVYHGEGGTVVSAPRALIRPLEIIPRPLRKLLPWRRFHYILTSRGCPYRCTFCASASLWKEYRAFPPTYVVDEMEEMRYTFRMPYIHIFDDLFIASRTRLQAIQALIIERGLHRELTFGCHVRANIMSDELCEVLKEMNCLYAGFGAESGSPKLLEAVKGGTTTVEQNQRTVDLCHRHGIKLSGSFMIGIPGETEEDLRLTKDFILRNRKKFDAIEVALLCPYPGTPLWKDAAARGIVSETMDWNRLESHPFFCEMEVRDDYPYMGDVIPWGEFRKYIEEFQSIEREINGRWLKAFDKMEKGT